MASMVITVSANAICTPKGDIQHFLLTATGGVETIPGSRRAESGRPYSATSGMVDTAARLGLESSLRPRGRPRKSDAGRSLGDEPKAEEK
jgi:hypothetical protein